MADVQLPLSGSVTQTINPWTFYLMATGNDLSLLTVNVGTSSNPDIEKDVLSNVASYGKQLGRIGDALVVLLEELDLDKKVAADPRRARAIKDLKRMLADIANVKKDHGAKFVIEPS